MYQETNKSWPTMSQITNQLVFYLLIIRNTLSCLWTLRYAWVALWLFCCWHYLSVKKRTMQTLFSRPTHLSISCNLVVYFALSTKARTFWASFQVSSHFLFFLITLHMLILSESMYIYIIYDRLVYETRRELESA